MRIKRKVLMKSNHIDFIEKLMDSIYHDVSSISLVSERMGLPGHLIVEKMAHCDLSHMVAMCQNKRVWIVR